MPINRDIVIPIVSGLLVIDAKGMHELVHDVADCTRRAQRHERAA